ncbi:MAG TPA: response regulator, partial [Casimicrobiaceae bacterium]
MERASILIVDDRPDKRLALATVLEALDQDLVLAGSGEEALKHVLFQDFAVILLDVNMPGMDGLETAELIRRRRKSAHTPIIFITADFNDDTHTARGYRLGAVDYIASPVVPDILQAKVKVMVDLFLHARAAERRVLEHLALAEEKAARLAAERATRRLAFSARASAELGGSLDVQATLAGIGRLAVPYLADVSVVLPWRVDGNDAPSPHAAVVEPGRVAISRPLGESLDDALAHAVECAGASARTVRLPEPGASAAEGATVRFPFGAVAHSAMILPLAVGTRVVGVVALGVLAERRFEFDALAVAGDLADRAAAALDNALLYRRIQDSDQRKNEFLAMLAHELR